MRRQLSGATFSLARFSLVLVVVTGALLPWAFADAPTSAPAGTRPAAGVLKPAFEAISYYDVSCAKCHGPQGSFYGPTLGKKLTDAQLLKIVKDMAAGPAFAPLEDDQAEVETAYHRAIMAGTPFVSLTRIASGELSGEVMPESSVTVTVAGKLIDAKVEESTWTAKVPPGTKPEEVELVAVRGTKKTTLVLKHGVPYSHDRPAPPPTTAPAK